MIARTNQVKNKVMDIVSQQTPGSYLLSLFPFSTHAEVLFFPAGFAAI